MARVFSYSIASVSWIDAKTGLPEVDEVSYIYGAAQRGNFTSNYGYRFCNFMDVYITVDANNKIVETGFYNESRIYRGPSFAHIPSHAFDTQRYSSGITNDSVTFRQTAGARTVSPEMIGEVAGGGLGIVGGAAIGAAIGNVPGAIIGGIIGGIAGGLGGQTAAHQITGFPPIWSTLEIVFKADGYAEGRLVQHSLFPSLTLYEQTDSTIIRGDRYLKTYYYDARKEVELPKWKDAGWGPIGGTVQASGGNPWGISKGIRGADEGYPN